MKLSSRQDSRLYLYSHEMFSSVLQHSIPCHYSIRPTRQTFSFQSAHSANNRLRVAISAFLRCFITQALSMLVSKPCVEYGKSLMRLFRTEWHSLKIMHLCTECFLLHFHTRTPQATSALSLVHVLHKEKLGCNESVTGCVANYTPFAIVMQSCLFSCRVEWRASIYGSNVTIIDCSVWTFFANVCLMSITGLV